MHGNLKYFRKFSRNKLLPVLSIFAPNANSTNQVNTMISIGLPVDVLHVYYGCPLDISFCLLSFVRHAETTNGYSRCTRYGHKLDNNGLFMDITWTFD